ncbi:Transcription factor spt8 [Sporothrix epigloea]|uniref:Transcription factor spt8 n=1 Tax=Sporothrix epigloea TaxID=1892477 RepID=A0ABP0DYW4_9PEZI
MEDIDEDETEAGLEPKTEADEEADEAEEVYEGDYNEPDTYMGPRPGDAFSGDTSSFGGTDRIDIAPPYPYESSGPRQRRSVSFSAAANGTAVDSVDSMAAAATAASRMNSASPHAAGPTSRLQLRAYSEALHAKTYDILPTMAAPQATSINALAITPDLRYWMTGGSDGYIRKYDGPGTINGRQLLTVAQRHPFVDSVVKAGILMSYWENEEPPSAATRGVEEHILSPVYSLAIHSRALWLLAGTENGGINLQSVRHDEGKRITCLQRHTNAVSVLQLAPDEKSVLSGSWDKAILDWDLNTGQVRREFTGSSGQLSAIELRPASGAPIPAHSVDDLPARDAHVTLTSSGAKPLPNGVPVSVAHAGPSTTYGGDTAASGNSGVTNGKDQLPDHESLFGSPGGSLFGGSDAMGAIPFEDEGFGRDVDMVTNAADTTMDALATTANFHTDSPPANESQGENSHPFAPNEHVPGVAVAGLELQSKDADAPVSTRASSESLATLSGAPNDQTTALHMDAGRVEKNPTADDDLLFSQQQQQQRLDQELQQSAETQLLGGEEADNSSHDLKHEAKMDIASEPQGVADEEKREGPAALVYSSESGPPQFDPTQVSENTFLSSSIDGLLRIWDRRQNLPVARIGLRPGVPPWCMGACWSPDGNRIYAGRRNGTIEEFDIHKAKAGWQPERALRFPLGSGPISAVRAMANGRHLVCASHDILRLYDVQQTSAAPHSNVPFLIIPGPPRPGVISHLYIDQTSRYLISTAGTRGWEGNSTETLIGYEIKSVLK